MEFRVLGPMEVADGGRLLDIGPRMSRAILAALLVEANRVVSLDRLIDQLWGQQPPVKAVGAVHVYISNLRRALEPSRESGNPPRVLLTRPPGYVLQVGQGSLDAERFADLATDGRSLLRNGQACGAREVLQQGLALWRGEAYVDLAFEAFLQPEITRLNELRASAVEALLEAELALGEHTGAVAELERMVIADPLRERRWELLALALYRCGRQAEALGAITKARRMLAEELGLELGPSLRRLENDILQQSPLLDWQSPVALPGPPVRSVPASPSAPADHGDGPFVGRDRELSCLREAVRRARNGRGGVALLAGEPGIGKTRLAEELAGQARTEGVLMAWGRCHEGEGVPAFWPWMQVVRAVAERLAPEAFRDALGSRAAEIAQIVPEVKDTIPELQPVRGGLDPTAARTRLYDAMSRFLLQLATRRQPLVLIIDDLHWADRPSVELFGFFASQLKTVPVVAVGTYRGGEVSNSHPLTAILASLARQPNASRITIGGLSRSEVAHLLTQSTGTAPSDKLLPVVWDRTEGNPFFIGELMRLIETEGNFGCEIPERVRDVVHRRVALLPGKGSRLLSVASVLGRDFDFDVLTRVGGYDIDEVLELVETALGAHLLLEIPGAVGRYRFSHALVRDTLYEELSALRRARLHHQVAETLEARDPADPVELAHHYWQATVIPGGAYPALVWLLRAAEQAMSRLAYEQTEELLNRALQLCEHLPSGAERDRRELDILDRRWQLLDITRGRAAPEVGRVAARAVELSQRLDSAPQLGAALYRLALFHALRCEIDMAVERATQLLTLAENSGDPRILFLGLVTHGYSQLYQGQLKAARYHLEQAMTLTGLLQDETLTPVLGLHPAIVCWSYLTIVLGLMGEQDRAEELSAEALALANRLGNAFTRAYALVYDLWLGVIHRDFPQVCQRADEVLAACRQGGFPIWWEAVAAIKGGWAHAHHHETAAGVARIIDGLETWRMTSNRRYLHFGHCLLGEAHLLESRPDNALIALDEGLNEVRRTGERFYEAELHRLRGEALALLSPARATDAESSLRHAVAVARAQGAALLEGRATASLDAFLQSGRVMSDVEQLAEHP